MAADFATRLAAIDRATLAPLVEQALAQPQLEILDWKYELLHGGFGQEVSGVYGVYRFRGHALAQAEILPWSLVLKASGSSQIDQEPAAWNNWRREALFYQSDLLATSSSGLTATRCYEVVEPVDGEVWLWLEDIQDEIGRHWPVAHYAVAANHLGQFNGPFLSGRPLPQQPWLTQGAVPDWLLSFDPYLSDLPAWRSLPDADQVLPVEIIPRLTALWAQRVEFLHALEQLPRCFCHRDAFRRNLFARHNAAGQPQTVAIDWSFAGNGVVGTEASKLCINSLTFMEVPISHAKELDATIFAAYVEGLQAAGWQGDSQVVRCAYTMAATFGALEQLARDLEGLHAGVPHAVVEQIFGYPVPQILSQHANLLRFALELAAEANELRRKLKI